MTHKARVQRTQTMMAQQSCDLVLLSPGANMLYLSGFSEPSMERLLLLVVRPEGQPGFIAPRLFKEQIEARTEFSNIDVLEDGEEPGEFLRRMFSSSGRDAAHVMVEDALEARWVLALQDVLPKARLALASALMAPQRLRKDSDEVASLEKAAAIGDSAFGELCRLELGGRRESEVAGMLEAFMLRAGADSVAFPVQVASGPNSALPHHATGQRTIAPGDMVVLDFGCRVNGYCSDMTRTLACGEIGSAEQEVYEVVRRANWHAVQSAQPGILAAAVDAAARDVISRAGYAEGFIHRTGHGVGLDVHEEPYITGTNASPLLEGMVFTVEPGVYVPGRFGVRIEDTVLMTETGPRSLTRSPREMLVI